MIVAHMHANPGVIRRSCSYTISPPCSHAFDHIVDDVKWQLAANTRILALLQLYFAEISAGSCLIIDIRCSSTRSYFIHSTRASLICFWETSLGFIRCARFAVNTSILGIEVWVLRCTATKIYISRMAYRVEFVAAAWSKEKRDTHLRSNWRERSTVGAHIQGNLWGSHYIHFSWQRRSGASRALHRRPSKVRFVYGCATHHRQNVVRNSKSSTRLQNQFSW